MIACSRHFAGLLVACVLLLTTAKAVGETLTVAVAANFAPALRALAVEFEQQHAVELRLIAGSTGKHYAQIRNGAPFDVFFAADAERPRQLEQEGLGSQRLTYAEGRLVLWSSDADLVDTSGEVLQQDNFRRIAIANPRLAPYGKAAEAVLRKRDLWEDLQPKLVRGENINQAFQFVASGAAELGFVALSQIVQGERAHTGSHWLVPRSEHPPIAQQALVIKPSPAAQTLMDFIQSEQARQIIHRYGYRTPDV